MKTLVIIFILQFIHLKSFAALEIDAEVGGHPARSPAVEAVAPTADSEIDTSKFISNGQHRTNLCIAGSFGCCIDLANTCRLLPISYINPFYVVTIVRTLVSNPVLALINCCNAGNTVPRRRKELHEAIRLRGPFTVDDALMPDNGCCVNKEFLRERKEADQRELAAFKASQS